MVIGFPLQELHTRDTREHTLALRVIRDQFTTEVNVADDGGRVRGLDPAAPREAETKNIRVVVAVDLCRLILDRFGHRDRKGVPVDEVLIEEVQETGGALLVREDREALEEEAGEAGAADEAGAGVQSAILVPHHANVLGDAL